MKRVLVLIAVVVALGIGSVASAQSDALRVSFNELAPWKVLDQDGRPGGIDVELLLLVTSRMGVDVEFVQLPFKRGLSLMETGEIDLMTGVLRRPEREEYLFFISPPYKLYSNKAFFVRKGDESLITRHEDLHQLTVGTRFGGKYYPEFDTDPEISKSPVGNVELSLKMLLAGRLDAFVFTEDAGDYLIARKKLAGEVGKADFVYKKRQDVYFALSKKSKYAHRLQEFCEAMKTIVELGVVDDLKDRFLQTTSEN